MQSLARSIFVWIASALRDAGNLACSFATWWLGELRALVPDGLREFLAGEEHTLRIQVRGDLVHIGGGAASDESWDLSLDNNVDLPSTLQMQLRKGRDAVLILPAVAVLRRTVELPLAAASELYSATSFLIERLTPFRSAQVFHATRLLVRDKARKLVLAEMVVVPRQSLERILTALAARGIPLCAVRIEGDMGRPPFDLLPRDRNSSHFRRKGKEAWRPVLAAGLVLMIAGPLTIAYRTHGETSSLAAEVAKVAKTGGQAAALRTEVEARASAEAFMSARQRWPKAIEVLDALTRTLPDSTWVFRVDLRPGQAVLAGFSSDVPKLLERLTKAPFATPELTSPVVHGLAGGKSRFELRVQLKASEL